MKVLTLLLATLPLLHVSANPLPEALPAPIQDINLLPRADECESCTKNYTLCYNMCAFQTILNPAVCAASCGLKGCKVVSLLS